MYGPRRKTGTYGACTHLSLSSHRDTILDLLIVVEFQRFLKTWGNYCDRFCLIDFAVVIPCSSYHVLVSNGNSLGCL